MFFYNSGDIKLEENRRRFADGIRAVSTLGDENAAEETEDKEGCDGTRLHRYRGRGQGKVHARW